MKTFVMVTKMSPRNAHLIELGAKLQNRAHNSRAWLEQIQQKCPNVHFKAHYAILGYWDFMDIYEAPDEETAAKVSIISRAFGAHEVENWCAIPSERLEKLAAELEDLHRDLNQHPPSY
jgi:uncharacterized protein with GYD domain